MDYSEDFTNDMLLIVNAFFEVPESGECFFVFSFLKKRDYLGLFLGHTRYKHMYL